jgi:hypothetical protein
VPRYSKAVSEMRTLYIRHLLDEYMEGWGTAYPVIHGINISTPYVEDIQQFLAMQTPGQFIVVRSGHDINVRLCTEVKTVCSTCGSPNFLIRVVEELEAYIDSDRLCAKTTKLSSRKVDVQCYHCKEFNTIRVHNYPEIAAC